MSLLKVGRSVQRIAVIGFSKKGIYMIYCKRIISTVLCGVLVLCMVSCKGTTSNGLMQDASPSTSALALYTYNGDKVCRMFIFDSDTTQSILDELDAVKATEAERWSLDDITLPIYGLEIGSTDGTSILAAWSNGYWISQDEAVYSFDFDFTGLEQDYSWSDGDEFSSFAVFPCARILSQNESGWNGTLLTPAIELSPPSGITMTLEAWEDDAVTVNIINESGAEWSYGEYYSLQVLLDGMWYEIPAVPGNWGFNDIAYIIQDGEKQDKTFHLTMYGNLPAGVYRLVAENLSVESIVAA